MENMKQGQGEPPNENNDSNGTEKEVVVTSNVKPELRSIGRWYIGETIGRGGYSWVKRGYDKKTCKSVALKFIAKMQPFWGEEQEKQAATEIASLKQVRHPNVMKLFAFNMNAKYPTKNDEKLDCVLLVLEFAPAGELFDILYYTSPLETIVARTYFRQFIAGLEACHNAGVAHRDLKPQNLLLDSKFNLKITDFGLSKVVPPNTDTTMKTTYVGTKGYQAPELLLNRPYNFLADIFSAGVVLFISLAGYPPFERAHESDRWYNPLTKGDYCTFWEQHSGCPINNDVDAKDLLQRMFTFDPNERITISEIKQHKWFNGKFLEGNGLVKVLRARHRQMEQKRRKDAKKLTDLQLSVSRGIEKLDSYNTELPLYPLDEIEGIWDTHTTVHWKEVYNIVNTVVHSVSGHSIFNFHENTLISSVKLHNPQLHSESLIRFEAQVFRSREFMNGPRHETSDSDDNEINDSKSNDVVYVVRFRRLEGDALDWKKVLNQLLYKKCAGVLTGLPKWARQQFATAVLSKYD